MSEWVQVARLDDLREGEGFETGVEVASTGVGLFVHQGVIYAVGECTHERGPICQGQLESGVVACPWHSAKFDVTTGRCIQGPVACRVDGSVETTEMVEIERANDLVTFEVKSENDQVFVRPRHSGVSGAAVNSAADNGTSGTAINGSAGANSELVSLQGNSKQSADNQSV